MMVSLITISVAPVLDERNAAGIFFVPTGPLKKQMVLDVHLVHHLLSKFPAELLIEKINKVVSSEHLSDMGRKEFSAMTYNRQNSSESIKHFKRIVNYYLNIDCRSKCLNSIAADLVGVHDLHKSLYMDTANLADMKANNFIVGSHTDHHFLLSKLSKEVQEIEIVGSLDYLREKEALSDVVFFCYPYGGFHSFTKETEEILDDYGVNFSMNVEARNCSNRDLELTPHALPRYDCNQFCFGKATLSSPV